MEIRTEAISALRELAQIPIAFEVSTVFDIIPQDSGLDGLALAERKLETPWTKDYDAGEPPIRWAEQWDLGNWGFIGAWEGEERVGAAVIAWKTEGVNMLAGRADLAVLWDIRVAPGWRGKGLGRALFEAACVWAREHGCTEMKIETQNINVPACRFYVEMGCELWTIDRYAYPALPGEVMLLWRKTL